MTATQTPTAPQLGVVGHHVAPASGPGEGTLAGAPLVLGLDLSLTSTGWATGPERSGRLRPPGKLRGVERIEWLRSALRQLLADVGRPDLVVVEGPSFGSAGGQGYHEGAGWHWRARCVLHAHGLPTAIAPPSTVKKYATGVGGGPKAGKDAVLLAAAKRFPGLTCTDNNEVDALWLAAMGREHLGQPLLDLPAVHRVALAGVAWPEPTP